MNYCIKKENIDGKSDIIESEVILAEASVLSLEECKYIISLMKEYELQNGGYILYESDTSFTSSNKKYGQLVNVSIILVSEKLFS